MRLSIFATARRLGAALSLGHLRGTEPPGNGVSATRALARVSLVHLWGIESPRPSISAATRALARVSLVHLLTFTTSGCGSETHYRKALHSRRELRYRKALHLTTSATRALARVSPKRFSKIATLLNGATPQEGAKPFHFFPKNCLLRAVRARVRPGSELYLQIQLGSRSHSCAHTARKSSTRIPVALLRAHRGKGHSSCDKFSMFLSSSRSI